MFLKKWLIHTLRKHSGENGIKHAPFYVAGDGIAYTKADEVLKSTAVRNQLADVRKLRELSAKDYRGKSAQA